MNLSIAFLSRDLPSLHPNGASCQVHLLANALTARGHRLTVISRDPAPSDAGYKVVSDNRNRSGAWFRLFRPAVFFARQDYTGFDLIHAHGDDFLVWPPQPKVRTFYGSALWEAIYDNRPLYRMRQALFYVLEWISLANAGVGVGISRISQRALPAIRHVIPCCADERLYRCKGPKSTAPTILFVGHLSGRKRGDLLLRAFSQHILRAHPAARLMLATSERIGPMPGVEIHVKPTFDQLVDLYNKAWVVCSTSTYEGFGVPIIEAWAANTPIVSTPHQGARELIRHDSDGLLAEPAQLGAVLARVLEEKDLRTKLAAAGRLRAEALTPGRIAEEYEGVYRALLRR